MNSKEGNIVEKALALALAAHEGQMRKDSPTPYLVHPVHVAILLARYGFSDDVVAAGLVHDVVEDTAVSMEDIQRELGDDIAALVVPVTYDDTLPWIDRKKSYIEAVRSASDEVKAISVADKIANAESLIVAHAREGSAVWRHFNTGREKKIWFEEAVLSMLQESWKHPLVDVYAQKVEQMRALA